MATTTTEAEDLWTRLLARAHGSIPPDAIRTWLEPITPISWVDPTLTVSTPDQFSLDWAESKYSDLLASLAPVALGHPIVLRFVVDTERQRRPQMDFFATEHKPEERQQANNKKPLLSDRYTFEHFIVGKSNELAAAAAQAVAQAPGKVYNPLFIYGQTGLGKTHLMQAVAHEVLGRQSNLRILYLGAEQFVNELVYSIQSRQNAEFRRRFREADLLLIDDVHFLQGKDTTQQEFFHTFNALYEAGRQIILTSDRPPGEIGGLEARLVSRFQWGMVADIEPPSIEHRIAILKHKAELDHLQLTFPSAVLEFIAENSKSNVRELEGAIIKILAYASLKHQPINLALAQEVLNAVPSVLEYRDANHQISLQAIQRAVAETWGVTVEGLCSKARIKTLTIPRQIAMYIARTSLETHLTEIGKAFGNRDHSTVIHSLMKASELLQQSVEIRTKYTLVLGLLQLPESTIKHLYPLVNISK